MLFRGLWIGGGETTRCLICGKNNTTLIDGFCGEENGEDIFLTVKKLVGDNNKSKSKQMKMTLDNATREAENV